jgi:hypothetical protein
LHFHANLFDMYQLEMVFRQTRWEGGGGGGGGDGFKSKQLGIM